MIPFQSICEFLTHKQKYSWFYFDRDLLHHLTEEENTLAFVEEIKETDMVRVWYPRTKYTEKPLHMDEFKRLMLVAIGKNDMEEIKRLQARLKK